ncbi:MAG: hypothetical protein ACFFDH_20025 [Promethearchaeota archaeon]
MNEILKKSIETSKLENVEYCLIRVIESKDLMTNFNSFKDLLESIDIICIISNSIMSNIENTKVLLSNLKEKGLSANYYIIANFQDRNETALEVDKIRELLKEKTFEFSAIQKDSKERIFSIIEEIVRISIKAKEIKPNLFTKYNEIWTELEKARIFETQKDRVKAIEGFSKAAAQFKKLYLDIKLKREQKEINSLHFLCKAWECILYAEEYKEPKKFSEAMDHFIQASEIIQDSKIKLLALGNSEYCKILKFGMEFEQSNQTDIKNEDYLKIKGIFNKMVDLFKQGGFEKEVNWALDTGSNVDAFFKDLKKA